MNTKKIENESTPKGGKDSTKVVLTAAGAMAVGAGASVIANELLQDNDTLAEKLEEKEQPKEAQTEENKTAENEQKENLQPQQSQEAQQAQQTQQPPQPRPSDSPRQQPQQSQQPHDVQQSQQGQQPQDIQQPQHNSEGSTPNPIADDHIGGVVENTNDITDGSQPTPITDSHVEGDASNTAGTNNNMGDNITNEAQETEALAVAERLVGTSDIDPGDGDSIVNVNFEDTDMFYSEDGSDIPVVVVSTANGGEFMVADVDGDRVYDVVLDQFGNPISNEQAGVGAIDAEMQLNGEEAHIIINGEDSDDETEPEIIALTGKDSVDENEMEEIEEDEILADIFDEDNGTDEETEVADHLDESLDMDDNSDLASE